MKIQFNGDIPPNCVHCPYVGFIDNCPCSMGYVSALSFKNSRHPDCPIVVVDDVNDAEIQLKLKKARKKAKRWKRKYLNYVKSTSLKSDWIFCKDRLPKYEEIVIVCTKSGIVASGALLLPEPYSVFASIPYWAVDSDCYVESEDPIIAWMPWPKPLEMLY